VKVSNDGAEDRQRRASIGKVTEGVRNETYICAVVVGLMVTVCSRPLDGGRTPALPICHVCYNVPEVGYSNSGIRVSLRYGAHVVKIFRGFGAG
jgi:hypothetical protein